MEVVEIPRLIRNAGRFREVLAVLAKYGLAPWLKDVPGEWIQQYLYSADGQQIAELSTPAAIRMALTELGTTFIKLGQILSTRVDLVGPEVAEELQKLQADTPADDPAVVIETIRAELKQAPEELFGRFDTEAFASASIGQVHHAVLHDGAEVVVKVQHAGIESRIENDLDILLELAKLAEHYSPELAQYNPVATVGEFRKTLLHELDFTREARNASKFSANFADDDSIRFPEPRSELCSRRVLTMDRFRGLSLSNREALLTAEYDLSSLARRGADMFLKMVFRDGFYHADPHPGNLMVLQDSVIGVLDCGMVGRVDESLREQIMEMLMAVADNDVERTTDALVAFGQLPADFDRMQLQSDVVDFVDEFGHRSIEQFDLGEALNSMTAIIRRHKIILPSRVSLLIKMLVMLEGTAQQLSPDFSIAELLQPYQKQAVLDRLSPKRFLRKVLKAQRDWTKLADTLPGDLTDIINRLRRGSFDVHLQHRNLNSTVNRLVLGILSAALYMGSASMLSSRVPPMLWGASVPGAIGCSIALYLGIVLVLAVRKSGNI
jgi:ubiquinone biosynthesis protein